jgi:hypothetical protein
MGKRKKDLGSRKLKYSTFSNRPNHEGGAGAEFWESIARRRRRRRS